MLKYRLILLLIVFSFISRANSILIPMDEAQKNQLKAYGIAFMALTGGQEVDWLLNYRGGSFLLKYSQDIEKECNYRNVSYQAISESTVNSILTEIASPDKNMDIVKLEKAPRIAVYSPKKVLSNAESDAVTIVLDFAEIPYDILYDEEIIRGDLPLKYDWVHLHHEDFTGQYERMGMGRNGNDRYRQEEMARKLGFNKVSQMKLAVAKKIREFISGGGFLFAMCSAADTYDIALAADGVDIVPSIFDGDGMDPAAQSKLNFDNSFAFENFRVSTDAYSSEFSDINTGNSRTDYSNNFFTLFSFSAKWDQVPTMLTQDHDNVIKGFNGKTTAFRKSLIKPNVLIMGEDKAEGIARYIHGEFGKGQWTFYGGHDPEKNNGGGFGGFGGRAETDLNLYPHSPGYRLILNNVLFPAAKKKKQKT
jgi:hypothetical protein